MKHYITSLLLPLALLAWPAKAQTKEEVKQKLASSICDCFTKKVADKQTANMSKAQATDLVKSCFITGAANDMAGIQHAYGTNAFEKEELMRQLGREVGVLMVQSCPAFLNVSMAIAKEGADNSAATTGQTMGRLGGLHGTGLALLDLEVSKTEQAQFAWLQRLPTGDDLLPKLAQLKGQRVRVSWQEVDVLDPATATYRKVRQVIGIEQQ
jgi:hypothetical protein